MLLLFLSSSQGANFSWDAGNGLWNSAGNWSPAGPPDLADVARIGDLPGVSNNRVFLNQNDAVDSLLLADGMTFSNQDHTFNVIGDTIRPC